LTLKLTIKSGMREFTDEEGQVWIGTIQEEPGVDYKGRYRFVFRGESELEDGRKDVSLDDVRWNSERTAERTLRTMSDTELRRRLRSARGRSA